MNEEEKEICIYHIMPPMKRIIKQGTGDCRYCKVNTERNKNCTSYDPIQPINSQNFLVFNFPDQNAGREVLSEEDFKEGGRT